MKSLTKLYSIGEHNLPGIWYNYLNRRVGSSSTTSLTSASKKSSYIHVPGSSSLIGATIGQLIDMAPDRFGDQFAVIDCAQDIRKTHVEMKVDIDKVATGLLALNLQKRDRIAIWSHNRYEWVLIQMAAAKARCILENVVQYSNMVQPKFTFDPVQKVPNVMTHANESIIMSAAYYLVTLNPAYQPNELAYCLNKVGIRALIFPESFKTENYYEIIQKVVPQVADSKPGQIKCKEYPNLDTLITLSDKDFPGVFKFADILNAGGSHEKKKLEKLQNKIQCDDDVNIQFTSGTTGKPKAATLSHFGMNNVSVALSEKMNFFNKPGRICGQVPLFHCFGCVCVANTSIVSGTCTVLPSQGFSAEASLKSIEDERCTSIFGTPTMFIDILNHEKFNKTNLSSITTGIMGGATCPPELMKEVMEKMNCPGLVVGYGATETSPLISIHDSIRDDKNIKVKNAGMPSPNTEAKIVDSNDKVVPLGTPGEICIRGYNVMKGYWGDEEKTKEFIKDGWYHTGDIGTLAEDGYLTVVGRLKDMIIRGGENIYPKEIEDHLISHSKICDAYVIGVPDKRLGEEVCVWIKTKTNETITENEVKEFCKGKISHFKIPKHIRFVDSFPMTTSGKVQKYKMLEEMVRILENK